MRILSLLTALCLLFGSCNRKSNSQVGVSVYAAASLTEVVNELADSFQLDHPLVSVHTNWASSGTLARQIQNGAPADVFISAHPQWMNYLVKEGLTSKHQKVATNQLVMVASRQTAAWPAPDLTSLQEMLSPPRFAMGDPQHVPAGIYAKEALEYLGWYKTIKPMMIPTKDVRSALRLVELGEAPVGIVYHTDALKSSKVKTIMSMPKGSHEPILYQIALVKENEVAQAFYDYIRASENHTIWEKHGFIPFSE